MREQEQIWNYIRHVNQQRRPLYINYLTIFGSCEFDQIYEAGFLLHKTRKQIYEKLQRMMKTNLLCQYIGVHLDVHKVGQHNLRENQEYSEKYKTLTESELDNVWRGNRQQYELPDDIITTTDLGEPYPTRQLLPRPTEYEGISFEITDVRREEN